MVQNPLDKLNNGGGSDKNLEREEYEPKHRQLRTREWGKGNKPLWREKEGAYW